MTELIVHWNQNCAENNELNCAESDLSKNETRNGAFNGLLPVLDGKLVLIL
jgi:hypothetical protein